MGYTLIGVLSRQLQDEARTKESDLYVLTRRQWSHVYAAVKAWWGSKEGFQAGFVVGSSPALKGFGFL